jgi:hypothetical protein
LFFLCIIFMPRGIVGMVRDRGGRGARTEAAPAE